MTEHAAVPAALSPPQLEQLWAEHLKRNSKPKMSRRPWRLWWKMPTSTTCRCTPGAVARTPCGSSTGMTLFPHGLTIYR